MPCYHPLKAFIIGTNPETGKNILKVTDYKTQYLYKLRGNRKDIFRHSYQSLCPDALNCAEKLCKYSCLLEHIDGHWDGDDIKTLDTLPLHSVLELYYDFVTIPCGQCLGCRIDKSREWANRMMLELPYSSSSWFVTLTYDDIHVPTAEYIDPDGNIQESLTLYKKHLVDFNKRLRKHFGNGIRFYAAGEYGSETLRPHYHAIYFNLPLSDLKPYKRSFEGFWYYNSPTLEKLWGFGYVVVTEVTWQTCAYVARYVTKKRTGTGSLYYSTFNLEPEFALMSRRPGLGRRWYEEHGKEAYETYIIMLSTINGSIRFRPPHYFDNLYDVENPEEMQRIKENKLKMAENAARLKLSKTDLNYLELLQVEEDNFKRKTKSLVRSDV